MEHTFSTPRRAARQIFSLVMILAVLFSAAPTVLAAPTPSAPAPSSLAAPLTQGIGFTPGPCSFEQTTDMAMGMVLECGWLTVPEEYENPDGPTIQLAVAIIRSQAENPDPVPVVFLQGGPGGSTIDTYLQILPLDERLNTLNRDIILFDQRGTLYARPALFCEETYQLGIDQLNLDIPDEEADRQYMDALKACRDRLVSEGVNLSAYDSLENAADVDTLRQALGYEKIHLYGVSYGTLLALHVLREFPDGLASVTIDSVVPPQINSIADQPRVLNRGLEALFSACAADAACAKAYPNLETVFYEQIDRLNADPASISVVDYTGGGEYPALLDGDSILYIVIQMLYSTDLIPLIPRTIYQVRAGDYGVIETILSNVVFDRSMSYGMFYSVWCAEENNFDLSEVNLAGLSPQLLEEEGDSAKQFLEACAFWDVDPLDSIAGEAVVSDVPTLVLSGEMDPVTPPEYAVVAAEGLSHKYSYVFPNGGHSALTSGECQDSIFIQFLNNPNRAPDAACVAEQKMEFSTPGALVVFPKAISLVNPQGADLAALIAFGLGLLFLLSALLVYPIVWLVRLVRGPAKPVQVLQGVGPDGAPVYASVPAPAKPRKPLLYRLAPWLAALTALMLLVFIGVVYGVIISMALGNDNRVLFGLPGIARPLFLLPLLAVIAVALMFAGAAAAWAKRSGSVWGRLYLSLLSLAGGVCVIALVWFGALQALFLG